MKRKAIKIQGLRPGLPMLDYLSIDACGGSDLEHMRRSPAYCKMMMDREDKPSEPRDFGTATHSLLLEPDTLESVVGFLPEGFTARSDANKSHLATMRGEYTVVLKHERKAELELILAGVKRCEAARALLFESRGGAEMTGTVLDPDTGCMVKIRPDRLVPELRTVVEIKTTRAESEEEFEKQVWTMGYHRKASYVMAVLGWLHDGGFIKTRYDLYAFIGIANTGPHETCVKAVPSSVLEVEMAEWRPHLTRYAECHELGEWPGWSSDVGMLKAPAWERNKYA